MHSSLNVKVLRDCSTFQILGTTHQMTSSHTQDLNFSHCYCENITVWEVDSYQGQKTGL